MLDMDDFEPRGSALQMLGRWWGNLTKNTARTGPPAGPAVPPGAGMLACRVLDPVGEPIGQAEFTLVDSMNRKVLSGETDPYGNIVATVPVGEYRLAVTADSYVPFHGAAPVGVEGLPGLGDIGLRPAPSLPMPQPGDWEIEPAHSRIAFIARHIGLARVHGSFGNFAGAVRIGPTMEQSAMHVVIDAASIDTNVKMRDDHLRSADFLDVEHFPTLEFYSDRFTHRGGNQWAVTGALSLHGVTRTVTLDVEYLGIGNGMEGETRVACRATTELHRDDYTVSWQTMLARGIAVVGSSIKIELDVQIVPKPPQQPAPEPDRQPQHV